jgi:hypothetical protein
MLEFNLDIQGLNPLTEFLSKGLPKRIDKDSKALLNKIGGMVVRKAKAFSPRLSGVLEGSIRFKQDQIIGGNQITVYVGGSRASDYAEYMHEGYYKLGAISSGKPGAGRKFIERAIKQTKKTMDKMYVDMLDKIGKEESTK